jgi:putative polyhydroxyalkanoate system protein
MATIDIRRAHGTSTDEAATKMRGMLDRFAEKRADLIKDVTWAPNGQRADVKGKGFKGSFAVDATNVSIAIDLSFVVRAFKGRIEDELTRRLNDTFSA